MARINMIWYKCCTVAMPEIVTLKLWTAKKPVLDKHGLPYTELNIRNITEKIIYN
jgi:hypothetical protein